MGIPVLGEAKLLTCKSCKSCLKTPTLGEAEQNGTCVHTLGFKNLRDFGFVQNQSISFMKQITAPLP